MKIIKLLSLIGIFAGITSCASYQTDMNANIPNENDVPLKTNMPPMGSNSDSNMN